MRGIVPTLLAAGLLAACSPASSGAGPEAPAPMAPETMPNMVISDTEEMMIPDPWLRTVGVYMWGVQYRLRSHKNMYGSFPSILPLWYQGDGSLGANVDAWKTELRYESNGADYTLRSAGPDRTWETSDDIVVHAGTDLDQLYGERRRAGLSP